MKNLLLIPVLSFALFLAACDEPTPREAFENAVNNYSGAPEDATNIVILDDRWYTFEWRGQCFLVSRNWQGTHGIGLMANIDCDAT